jgi:hypothetical protein
MEDKDCLLQCLFGDVVKWLDCYGQTADEMEWTTNMKKAFRMTAKQATNRVPIVKQFFPGAFIVPIYRK